MSDIKSDISNGWPVLTTYEAERLREVVFPLGGIGTGTIGLGGRAEFRDFEICNRADKGFNPPWTFFTLRAQSLGQEAVTRVLPQVASTVPSRVTTTLGNRPPSNTGTRSSSAGRGAGVTVQAAPDDSSARTRTTLSMRRWYEKRAPSEDGARR